MPSTRTITTLTPEETEERLARFLTDFADRDGATVENDLAAGIRMVSMDTPYRERVRVVAIDAEWDCGAQVYVLTSNGVVLSEATVHLPLDRAGGCRAIASIVNALLEALR